MIGNKHVEASSRKKMAASHHFTELQRNTKASSKRSANKKGNNSNNHPRPSSTSKALPFTISEDIEKPKEVVEDSNSSTIRNEPIEEDNPIPVNIETTSSSSSLSQPHSKKKALWLKLNFTVKTAKLQTLKRHKYQHLQEEALLKARGLLDDWENGPVLLTEDLYRLASLEGRDTEELLNYTPEALALRFSLRNDPNILLVIRDLWTIDMNRDSFGCLQENAYKDFLLHVAKCLEYEDFDRKQAEKQIEDDWKRDAKGETAMSFANFFDAMFELADLWCETMNPQEYVTFLTSLRDRISCVNVHSKRILQKLKLVPGIHQEVIQTFSNQSISSTHELEPLNDEKALSLHAQALAVTALPKKKKKNSQDSITSSRRNSSLTLSSSDENTLGIPELSSVDLMLSNGPQVDEIGSKDKQLSHFGSAFKALTSMTSLRQTQQNKTITREPSSTLRNSISSTTIDVAEQEEEEEDKKHDLFWLPKPKYSLKKDSINTISSTIMSNKNRKNKKKHSSGLTVASNSGGGYPSMNLNDPFSSIQVISTASIGREEAATAATGRNRIPQKTSSISRISLSESTAGISPNGSDNSSVLIKVNSTTMTGNVQNDIVPTSIPHSTTTSSLPTTNSRQSIQLSAQNFKVSKEPSLTLSGTTVGGKAVSNTQMEKNSLPSNSHFSSFSLQQFPIETSSLEALQITSTRAFSTSTSTSVAALSEKKISRSQILQKPPKTPNHFKSHSLSLQEVPTPWTTRISEFEPNFDENINRSRGLSLDQSPQGNNGTQSRWVPIHSLSRGSIKEKSLNASKSKQTSNIKHKASKNLNDWLSEFSFFSEEDLSEEVEEDEIDKPIDVESPCTSSSSPSNDVEQVKEEDEVDKPIEATSSTVSSIQVCTSSSPLSTEEVPLAFTPPYVPNKEVKEDDVDKSATPKVGFVRVCASSSMDEVRTPIYVLEHKEEQDENIGSDGSTKTLQASLSVTSLGNCSSLSSIPRLISSSQCRTTSRLLLFPATAERNLRPYQPEDLDRMEGEMFMREKPRLQRRHLSDHLSLSPNASNLAHILSLQLPEDIISARTAATLEAENDPVLSVDTAPVRSSFKMTSFSRTKTTFGLRPIQEPRKQSTTKQRKTPLEILGEVPLTGYDSMMPKTSLIPLSVLALAENCKQKPMPSVVCTCFQKSMHPRSMQQCAAHFKFEIPEEGEIDEEGYEGDGYLDGDGSLVVEEHDKCPPLAPLDTPFEDGINRSQTSPAGSPTLPPVSSGATSLSAPLSPSRSRASKRVEPPMILINSTISMDLENHVETIIQGQEENRDKFTPKKVSRPQYTFGRKLTSYVQ